MTHSPSANTVILIALFTVGYLTFLLRKILRGRLDLYDLIMLSTVAVVPAAFAFFPGLADLASRAIGVAFPFVIMFGILLFVLFLLVHRLTVHMHRVETKCLLLVQELSLLRLDLEHSRHPQDDRPAKTA